MTILVTDSGFSADDWTFGYTRLCDFSGAPETAGNVVALDLGNDTDVAELSPVLDSIDMIRVHFPSFTDGRGFSQARRLRDLGYSGRLRAAGYVLADQYAMARRSGFDEVEIDEPLASRQTQEQWLARIAWQKSDYQSRLRQFD